MHDDRELAWLAGVEQPEVRAQVTQLWIPVEIHDPDLLTGSLRFHKADHLVAGVLGQRVAHEPHPGPVNALIAVGRAKTGGRRNAPVIANNAGINASRTARAAAVAAAAGVTKMNSWSLNNGHSTCSMWLNIASGSVEPVGYLPQHDLAMAQRHKRSLNSALNMTGARTDHRPAPAPAAHHVGIALGHLTSGAVGVESSQRDKPTDKPTEPAAPAS